MARDLVFCRFVDMGISDVVPHHTVFVRFRATLHQHGLFEVLFNEINQQLTAQLIILKQGQIGIIDATVSQTHRARPRKGSDGNNTQDPDNGIQFKTCSEGQCALCGINPSIAQNCEEL